MKVLIADDHVFMQLGLRQYFDIAERDGRLGTFEIVGLASTGEEAVEMMAVYRPELVCLDVSLPGMTGFEAARQIRRHHPDVKIIFISMHDEASYVRQGLEVGANAYLSKHSDPTEFVRALLAVLAGRSYIGESILNASALNGLLQAVPKLTERQLAVLQAVSEGLSIEQTAVRLGITRKTVEYHRGQLMRKWELKSPVDIYKFAVAHKVTRSIARQAVSGAAIAGAPSSAFRSLVGHGAR